MPRGSSPSAARRAPAVMAREYDYYMQLHNLQPPPPPPPPPPPLPPPPPPPPHYFAHGAGEGVGAGGVPPFELTAAAAAGGVGVPAPALLPAPAPPHLDPRKRKHSHYSMLCPADSSSAGAGAFEVPAGRDPPLPPPSSTSRKRKTSSYGDSSLYDEGGDDDTRSSNTLPDKKQNHSEIEKRRRDKMNTYISELSAMVPVCGAMARKLDKLTVLRLAVQHLRGVRGALAASPLAAPPRPHLLSERERNQLVLDAAEDAFLLVVGCDRGRLLYVSASVTRMLHYEQSDLLGQSLFDILHPKDVAKVKEQLSSSDISPRERLIDAKTMLPVKADVVTAASRLCPGARRSFLCRVKCRTPPPQGGGVPPPEPSPCPPSVKEEPDPKMRKKPTHEKKYCVVQCTGYLKSWSPAKVCEGGGAGGGEACEEGEPGGASCLVAVCRALPPRGPRPPPPARPLQYVSRHATDGKFLFVDQRVTLALGFLPQELLGTSLYEHACGPQLGGVARAHKSALLRRAPATSPPYTVRTRDGTCATIQTHFKPFRNPWTKDVECLVANNTVLSEDSAADENDLSYEFYKQNRCMESDGECEGMQRLIDSQLESHKIGSAIAEEALRRSSPGFSPDLPPELLHDNVFNPQISLVDNILGVDGGFNQVRNNVPLSAAGADGSPPPQGADGPQGTPPPASPPLPPLGLDGNGEAAMAVIMSLLEADAGLGGPVNFSGLPWPLP